LVESCHRRNPANPTRRDQHGEGKDQRHQQHTRPAGRRRNRLRLLPQIFKENPKLLKERSNNELLKRWLADHPGHKEVPQKVKNNLANVKSVLRKKSRKKGGRPPKSERLEAVGVVVEVAKPRAGTKGLEALEEQIDECSTWPSAWTGRGWWT
jgi:hypothetical protein